MATVTAAQYQEGFIGSGNVNIKATINGVVCYVPLDALNSDYQAILAWAEIDGNAIADAD
tara:strand:+ start:322 stop:501 length:180 start_codon:yes stop_codon:yes gene_type:complete